MFSKEVTYTDPFNGAEKKKTLYFNLTQKELMDITASIRVDDLNEYITRIQEAEDKTEMYKLFNMLVLTSYGERTVSGGFVKKDIDGRPLSYEFESSEAYSNFMMDLFDDPTGKLANEFLKKVIPANMASKVEEEIHRLENKDQK